MKKQKLFLLLLILVIPSTIVYSKDICIFKRYDYDYIYNIKNYLSQNSNYSVKIITNFNFENCSVLIVDQEHKSSSYPIFDKRMMVDAINSSKIPTILIYNAVMLVNDLFGVDDVKVGAWNPSTYDILYLRIIDNSTFLDYPVGSDVQVWRQVPGDDASWYFYKKENTSGRVLATTKICYFGSCSYSKNSLITEYSRNDLHIIAMRLRFSSQFRPTADAYFILGKAVRYLLHGNSNVGIEEASWGRDLIVEFNSSGSADVGCQSPQLMEISVNGRPENFTQNYLRVVRNYSGAGSYAKYRFSAKVVSKWLGNATVSFRDSCGHSGSFSVVRTSSRRSGVFFVVGDSWRSILRSSIYGYPFLSFDGSEFKRKWIGRVLKKAKPRTVLCVDPENVEEWNSFCDFFIGSKSLKYQFGREENGGVLLGDERSMQIYGASYAAKNGKYIIFSDELDGNVMNALQSMNLTCFDRNCMSMRMDRHGEREDLLSYFPSYTGKYVFVNPYSEISAITPFLYLHGYVPVVVDGKGDVFSENASAWINLSRRWVEADEAKILADEISGSVFIHQSVSRPEPEDVKEYPFMILLGIPVVKEDSPLPDFAGNELVFSDRIYREELFGKYMSRIVSDTQLIPLFAEIDTNPVLIAASYRQPRYMDAQYTGMDAGFVMDLFLKLKGFNTTRRIEQRMELSSLLLDNFDFMSEDAFIEAMVQEVLDNLGIASAFNNYMDMKYTLLETDWEKTLLFFQPSMLDRLNNTKLSKDMEKSDIFIYFGVGNSTHLILPPDKPPYERNLITNPYPGGNDIWYGNISSIVSIIESSHSLAGIENGTGFSQLPAVVGITGKTVDPFSASNLFAYISAINSNDSLSSIQWRLGEQVELFDDGVLSTILSLPISFMKNQYISTNYIGLPDIAIDPRPSEREYVPHYRNGTWEVEIMHTFNYTTRNGTVFFSNPDFYLMAPGRPIVPVYVFRIQSRGNETLSFAPSVSEADLSPVVANASNQSIEEWSINWSYMRKVGNEILLYVIPVKYNLSGKDMIMDSFSAKISLLPELGIMSRCENGTLYVSATQECDISIPSKGFHAHYNGTWIRVGEVGNATVYAFNGTARAVLQVSCVAADKNVTSDNDHFKLPKFSVVSRTKSPSMFRQLLESPFESIEYIVSNESKIVYSAPGIYLVSISTPIATRRILMTPDYRLNMSLSGRRWVVSIETPEGWLVREMENGSMTERAYGSLKDLDDRMEKAINSLKGNVSYIRFVLSHYRWKE